jgi:hypothetical protein
LSTGGVLNLNTAGYIDLPQVNFNFNGGALNSTGTFRLNSGQGLSGFGSLNANFLGSIDSSLTVVNGQLTVGNDTSPNGFATSGNVTINQDGVLQVNDSNFATFGGNVLLDGGIMQTSNYNPLAGISFLSGSTLTARGTVDARVIADAGSTISNLWGNLTLGNANKLSFFSAGDLLVGGGGDSVTLLGINRATLGIVTSMSGGTLIVDRGAFVDFGRVMMGNGSVNSINSLANAMIINGDVIGQSPTSRITFEGYVKGLGTFNNVTMNGTFSPGLSPAITFSNNLGLGSNSILEMEIAGLNPGTEHDKLIDSGNLMLNGTLKLVLLNGFSPNVGDQFDLFDWNTLVGSFLTIDLSQAVLGTGLYWDMGQLYTNGVLSVSAVPEPAGVAIFWGLLYLVPRRRSPILKELRTLSIKPIERHARI